MKTTSFAFALLFAVSLAGAAESKTKAGPAKKGDIKPGVVLADKKAGIGDVREEKKSDCCCQPPYEELPKPVTVPAECVGEGWTVARAGRCVTQKHATCMQAGDKTIVTIRKYKRQWSEKSGGCYTEFSSPKDVEVGTCDGTECR